MYNAHRFGVPFSVETDDGKRRAYMDELTDAQLKFLFHGEAEREKMKQEQMDTPSKTSI
jgi:hypothetical protein